MQEYFVRERCQPKIQSVEYSGCQSAAANPAALDAIEQADLLIIAPSNPVLSIAPTLAIPAIRKAVQQSHAYRIAMSPLINGQAIKGPTGAVLQACGYSVDLMGIADFYTSLIDGLVIDQQDQREEQALSAHSPLDIYTQNTLMGNRDSRITIARELLQQVSDEKGGRCE